MADIICARIQGTPDWPFGQIRRMLEPNYEPAREASRLNFRVTCSRSHYYMLFHWLRHLHIDKWRRNASHNFVQAPPVWRRDVVLRSCFSFRYSILPSHICQSSQSCLWFRRRNLLNRITQDPSGNTAEEAGWISLKESSDCVRLVALVTGMVRYHT